MISPALLDHAVLRRARPEEFPYPASICADREVRVQVSDAPAELWQLGEAQHILAPLDLALTPDAVAYVFPACEGRLSAALATRAPLRPGEAVSVAVSLLRGAAEAADLSAEGCWWLADRGRPVLALGGGEGWRAATGHLLETLAADQSGDVAAALTAAAESLAADAPVRWGGAEDALFAAAEPEPLRAPVSVPAAPSARDATAVRHDGEASGSLAAIAGRAGAMMDTALGDRVRSALASVRPHFRARDRPAASRAGRRRPEGPGGTRRRAPWVVAAAVAALILIGGALWPDPPDDGETRQVPGGEVTSPLTGHGDTAPAPDTDAATSAPEPAAGASAAAAPADAVTTLLARWRTCGGDPACAPTVLEDAAREPPAALDAAATDAATPELVDEYGGAAAVRVGSDGGASRIVVVVRVDREWLIRDVYDVADQL